MSRKTVNKDHLIDIYLTNDKVFFYVKVANCLGLKLKFRCLIIYENVIKMLLKLHLIPFSGVGKVIGRNEKDTPLLKYRWKGIHHDHYIPQYGTEGIKTIHMYLY